MTSVKTIFLGTLIGGLALQGAVADETATVHGIEITVSGSKSAEERFKRIAQEHAEDRKKSSEKEARLRSIKENADLGPLKPYITGHFFHGFDWSELQQYEHMDTDPLFRLLEDPAWIQHWRQTVRVLGAIVDKKGAERIMAYILRDDIESDLIHASMKAKVTAVAALGRTVRRGVYPEGTAFLQAHVNPGAWSKTLKNLNISDSNDRVLRKQTIMVLSAIGTDDAVKTLEKAREAMVSTYTRGAGEAHLNESDKERLSLIDFYLQEAKLGPLESRPKDRYPRN